jgi:uncharacterized protein (DUF983 family)
VNIPIRAILHQRCPRCRQGPIFRVPLWRGPLTIWERCPVCGLKYEREPGYFLGAMYFSYILSIPPGLALVLLIRRITGWQFDVVMGCAFVAYLPLVPAVSRWARVLWLYLDRTFDPDQ